MLFAQSGENRQVGVGLSVCFSSHGERAGERDTSLMTRNILYGGQLAGGVECQKSEREGEQQLEDVPTTPIEVNINTTSTHPTLHIWLRLKHTGSFDPAVLSSSFSAYYYRSFARGHDNAHSFHSSIHEEGCAVIDGSEEEV